MTDDHGKKRYYDLISDKYGWLIPIVPWILLLGLFVALFIWYDMQRRFEINTSLIDTEIKMIMDNQRSIQQALKDSQKIMSSQYGESLKSDEVLRTIQRDIETNMEIKAAAETAANRAAEAASKQSALTEEIKKQVEKTEKRPK